MHATIKMLSISFRIWHDISPFFLAGWFYFCATLLLNDLYNVLECIWLDKWYIHLNFAAFLFKSTAQLQQCVYLMHEIAFSFTFFTLRCICLCKVKQKKSRNWLFLRGKCKFDLKIVFILIKSREFTYIFYLKFIQQKFKSIKKRSA